MKKKHWRCFCFLFCVLLFSFCCSFSALAAENMHTVTFFADGEAVYSYQVPHGGTLAEIPTPPAKEGYDREPPTWDVTDFSNIRKDLQVHAVYTQNTYTVLLPTGNSGYTVTSVDGRILVLHGGSFTFRFSLAAGYAKQDDFQVLINNKEILLPESGLYTISNIQEDISVTVRGVEDSLAPQVSLQIGDKTYTDLAPESDSYEVFRQASEIRITAEDLGVGGTELFYCFSDLYMSEEELERYAYFEKYTEPILFSEGKSGYVYVKVYDKNRNTTFVSSPRILCDGTPPALSHRADVTYYGVQSVTVEDAYLSSVTVNGKRVDSKFSLVPADQPYLVLALDRAGNRTEVSLSVKKAVPNYTVPPVVIARIGDTLGDVVLPSDNHGTFMWTSPLDTGVGAIGEHTFYAVYVPTNTQEYQIVTGIAIRVQVTYHAHPAPTTVTAEAETLNGKRDGKILGVSEGMEYRSAASEEDAWITIHAEEITGLAAGVYYVRYAESMGYSAGSYAAVTVEAGRDLSVKFYADGVLIDTFAVAYGAPLEHVPAIPRKPGYNFTSPYWDQGSFEAIYTDLEVHAVYTQNTYTVYYEESERYTLILIDSENPVKYGEDFRFRLEIAEGFMQGEYFYLKNNDTFLFPDENGVYTISAVSEIHTLEIYGVVNAVDKTSNWIEGIDLNRHYAIGDKLEFTVRAAGWQDVPPEAGDLRYTPISWYAYYETSWSKAPYTASFTLFQEGECAITVSFRKEIYNGTNWVQDGIETSDPIILTVHKLPAGIPRGNSTLSTIVCAILIFLLTGGFLWWHFSVGRKRKK